jgi:hypothetical protein
LSFVVVGVGVGIVGVARARRGPGVERRYYIARGDSPSSSLSLSQQSTF